MFDYSHLYIIAGIVLAVIFRQNIYAFLFPKKALLKELTDILPFIDPDSNRMVEIITFRRLQRSLDTKTGYFKVSDNVEVTLKELVSHVKPYFEQSYQSDYLFRGLRISKSPVTAELYVVIEANSNRKAVHVFGDPVLVDRIISVYKEMYTEPRSIKIEVVTGVGPNGFITETNTLVERDAQFSKDEFYPFIEGGVTKLINDFAKSESNALVLIGPWGTGKTTLIRTLMMQMQAKTYGIVNSTVALESPALIPWLRSLGDAAVIAIEDSDELVRARTEGNHQMAGLLGTLNGVVPTKTKIIIATNLESGVNKIDPALLREGRTFKVITTRALTFEETNIARGVMGLEAIPIEEEKSYSLAKGLNWTPESAAHSPEKIFGFGKTSN